MAIPILIILGMIMGSHSSESWSVAYSGGGIVFVPTLLMILFRKKYPKWWFDWNIALTQFGIRVLSYLLLLRDEYPSTDEEQAVHLDIPYPDVEEELHRAMPLVKWFLAIPHAIILGFLYIAVSVCTVVSWFAILFTGKVPQRSI